MDRFKGCTRRKNMNADKLRYLLFSDYSSKRVRKDGKVKGEGNFLRV